MSLDSFRKTVIFATQDATGKLSPVAGGAEALEHLLHSLVERNVYTVETAKDLAKLMAGITHNLRDAINKSFDFGSQGVIAWLNQWLTSFRETLIPELKNDEFADMFAQTLAYGLFAARIQTSKTGSTFSHAEALLAVPKSNPFLRKIFSEMAGADMPDEFRWAVDDLVRLLEMADIGAILKNFGKESGQNDPIVHFYETFLAAYDPKLREKRGVYYTPEPVVGYIVRSVDSLLKTHFNKPKGLADERTLILDPATGTATFLYEVIAQIRESMKGQEGAWPGYVRDHLLKRIFGFELLMAPYAVAHLKLGLELEQTGYTFAEGERLGIYLTNTLEEASKKSDRIIAQAISDEAEAAAEIKREKPILVVLGNPPYSGHSANRSTYEQTVEAGGTYFVMAGGPRKEQTYRVERKAKKRRVVETKTFIGELIEEYKWVDGEPLGEKNPKWLQDDYVKFIRFAQWRVERTGTGILAFITNHSYLANPTFRGMRRSLMETFNEIHIYDLHGNSNIGEKAPGGEVDENIFDIKQGVALLIAVKKRGGAPLQKVQYADMWGTRTSKYYELSSNFIGSTNWNPITPAAPRYEFAPRDENVDEELRDAPSLSAIFSVSSIGIVTARDGLSIQFRSEDLVSLSDRFLSSDVEDARLAFNLGPDVEDWGIERAQKDLRTFLNAGGKPVQILYRPFDVRWTYFTGHSRGFMCRPRNETMQHMLAGNNLALISARSNRSPAPNHFYCSNHISEAKAGESTIQSYIFPLHLKAQSTKGAGLFFDEGSLNFSAAFLDLLSTKLQLYADSVTGLPPEISAVATFHYIYAIVHAPGYRSRYAEFLKRDFPRVPITSSLELFHALAEKGRELVALHLLKVEDAPRLDEYITTFPVAGHNEVTRAKYTDDGRVFINDDQYFAGLPAATWNFQIGGYQVLEKWLKDRKGRTLTFDDIRHWQRTAVALTETQRLMTEIDALIPSWPLQ